MLAIAPDDLARGRVLDCPSGPDSFVAEACALGFDATGCDPMYALPPDELAERGRANVEACLAAIDAQRDTLVFADFERFRDAKRDALERFLADYRAHHGDGRYRAASLTRCPSPTGRSTSSSPRTSSSATRTSATEASTRATSSTSTSTSGR